MSKKTKSIIGVVVAILALGLVCGGIYLLKNLGKIDYSQYDANLVHEGSSANGGIADHIKGNPDAEVLIFEYADYQCSGCATTTPWMEELVEEYDGKVAIVYRNYLLAYHPNARAAAAAVEAAGLQGYWQEYGDYLFANQADWFYAEVGERTDLFISYFEKITEGKGDSRKFRSDMSSSNVAKKISFDLGVAEQVKISATPTMVIDGEVLDWYGNGNAEMTKVAFMDFFRKAIDAKLNK